MRRLGDLEALVMARLWAADEPMTVRAVLEHLQQQRPLAYTTVMTVMDNLHKKDVLQREPDGRAYVYWPARSREEYAADLVEEALDVTEDRAAALLGFVDRMTPKEVAKLRRALGAAKVDKGRRR